jgi:predicted NAD/FAD-dependent oxidoreductase
MPSIAIVGAGLSGLVVARRLRGMADVVVFEKSRGPGGRMATRYGGDYAFDHGAQFFTARTDRFRDFLEPLLRAGAVREWRARFAELDRERITSTRTWSDGHPHYVGAPGMNQVGKFLADGLDIRSNCTVGGIERRGADWILSDHANAELGRFDGVVLALPPAQAAVLADDHPDLVALCATRDMLPCFALMIGLSGPLELPWDAALVRGADISWISVNSSKPDRIGAPALVAHSTNAWAAAHVEDDLDEVREHLLAQVSLVTGVEMQDARHCDLQRWRFANIASQAGPAFYFDEQRCFGACGDWFVRGRVEAAFTSGADLAESIVAGFDAPRRA